MAITKIHPIKATLNLAIDYITNEAKTDEKILVTTNNCFPATAHTQFLKTREDNNVKGNVLARHLIQSFLPNETTPEQAHQIGLDLCNKILKDEYEFVLTTHIDKGHIHNHIIFNNVNMVTGKCYQSNKKSYHKIRYQSDKLCKENNLIVIDEHYETYKKKYKTSGKSWYENEQFKKGTSWKSKLQFDIDSTIKQSKDWDDFLDKMTNLGYEIKHGKHIAFKHKDKERFTRSKVIGIDYTEDRIKERIKENANHRNYPIKKRIGNIIDIDNNEKVKSSKGYEYWATKHNLQVASNTVILMRGKGIKTLSELDSFIQSNADKRQELQDKIKILDKDISNLSITMEQVHIVKMYRQIYLEYRNDTTDKAFYDEHKSEITQYQNSLAELKKSYSKLPDTKDILKHLDLLHKKKNTLMQEYSFTKADMNELYQIRQNYKAFINNDLER
ncbi:MAG: relaxase/mobilization nuclease domain-containing protein [Amedibacillus dolichus]|uniref:Relaxase/mobilization nuclease domain-containing protein n=3 Tax=Amedibacillus dolichus TaxID=31971 RepID=A0A942WG25_9FIRM|nr:relaxase/mobilization nuclease domain-containing protein [Amedibacillus dolichus]MBS4883492.1 relaxase/mobilization nuclease domain-containing protein [Amedibacillus dolichus]